MIRAVELFRQSRSLGAHVVARELVDRLRSDKPEYELVCHLEDRPPVPSAQIPVVMEACAPTTFEGFDDELARSRGLAYGQALRRSRACHAGVPGLHVAFDSNGDSIYAQWLLFQDDREALVTHSHGPWRSLREDEALVEFAYTFTAFRGQRAMAAGMGQLLDRAQSSGKRRVYTYVRSDNVPSLRGCARIGFVPNGIVVSSYRAGRLLLERRTVTDAERALWDTVTAPRPR